MLVASRVPVNPHRDFFLSRVLQGHDHLSFCGSLQSFAAKSRPSVSRDPFGLRTSTQCGDEGNRTPDLLLAKQALYQLSYIPEPCAANHVRVPGFEPGTPS